jgi:hypothetical protein
MRDWAIPDSSEDLEQVHVRGMNRRSLRLEMVAGLGMALAPLVLLVLPLTAASAQGIGTTTTMTAQSATASSCSLTTLTVGVTSTTGVPAGTVMINDAASGSPVSLGSEALNSSGQASFVFALPNGVHTLSAAYAGNATYNSSSSVAVSQTVSSQCTASFVVTVSSLSPSNTLTAGQAGTGTITVTPLSSFVPASGAAPAFITLSCSGLPNQTSCIFSPESLEILPSQNEGVTSSMVLQTQAAGTARATLPASHGNGSGPVAWAILLPGVLGLGGLAWGARRRAWLRRLSLVALVGFVAMLGTTACNPRYYYYNHGPPTNQATPSGTFTITVTGQSSNGITAVTQNTTFALTVQ